MTASNARALPEPDLVSAFSSLLSALLAVPDAASSVVGNSKLHLVREVIGAVDKCHWSDSAGEGKVAVYARALHMLSAACRPVYPYHIGRYFQFVFV